MSESDMIAAAEAYLSLVDAPPNSSEARLSALAETLDRLAFVYHRVTETDLHYEVPDRSHDVYQAAHKAMGRRFPELGFYAVATSKDITAPPMTGDAIDDLVDIADELQQVQWLWDNKSPEAAGNLFRAGYRLHWGRHLQDLRGHLHALLQEP
ncbi:hypothetical protein FRZ44_48280 [Hypericibacter terrae]|uniref:DUF5063 domain-containing protein n=1 Tax=Hypericibacter terrae TaxID=2602015 RepID=A0A5J6MPZ3_9PROT|nr:DUF5063 domain-containing protein [Hypericibacter terrae]QEX19514.1 hypothetical protein FRZ44_48280 [Hypericibacter terrae]